MKTIATYTASIYVGAREGYTGEIRSLEMAREWLQRLANAGGLCVTLTPTEFIYKNGSEPGFVVGFINYPRFPALPAELKNKTLDIAKELLRMFKQQKVSVVFSDETIMLEEGIDA